MSLIRSCIQDNIEGAIIVNLGVKSSTVNLVKNKTLLTTRDLKIGEEVMVNSLANITKDHQKDRKMLYEVGFLGQKK